MFTKNKSIYFLKLNEYWLKIIYIINIYNVIMCIKSRNIIVTRV